MSGRKPWGFPIGHKRGTVRIRLFPPDLQQQKIAPLACQKTSKLTLRSPFCFSGSSQIFQHDIHLDPVLCIRLLDSSEISGCVNLPAGGDNPLILSSCFLNVVKETTWMILH